MTEPSGSEESLKEITSTTPRVAIHQPAIANMASKLEQPAEIVVDQYGTDTASARPGPSGMTFADDDEGEELVPSPRKRKKRKVREGMNSQISNNEECELVGVVTKDIKPGDVAKGQDTVDAPIPKKKKKKKTKSASPESLPPVVNRRPLPQLQLEDWLGRISLGKFELKHSSDTNILKSIVIVNCK